MKRSAVAVAVVLLLLTTALSYPASASVGPPVPVTLVGSGENCDASPGGHCTTEISHAEDGSYIKSFAKVAGPGKRLRAYTSATYWGSLRVAGWPVLLTMEVKEGTGATANCTWCDQTGARGSLLAGIEWMDDQTGARKVSSTLRELVWAGGLHAEQNPYFPPRSDPVKPGDVVTLCVPFPEKASDARFSLIVSADADVGWDWADVGEAEVLLNLGIRSVHQVQNCPGQ